MYMRMIYTCIHKRGISSAFANMQLFFLGVRVLDHCTFICETCFVHTNDLFCLLVLKKAWFHLNKDFFNPRRAVWQCVTMHSSVCMTFSACWRVNSLLMMFAFISLERSQVPLTRLGSTCSNPVRFEVSVTVLHPPILSVKAPYFSICWLIDWCCFYYLVRNSLVALLKALCAQMFSLDSWISVFFWDFFGFVCARSLTKPFFRPSQPGSCAWLSPFLLYADGTCVLVCVCLCICMWKCVGKVINI